MDIPDINTPDVCPKNEEDKKCAPGVNYESGSCIKLSILVEMAKAYNKENDKSKIALYQNIEILNPKKYKKYLLSEFNKRIGDKCTTQKCWTDQQFVSHMKNIARNELKKYTFRPDGPEGKFEWLNTLHINDVMTQHENDNKDFKFLGAVPIDFDDLENLGIKNLDYKTLVNNGTTKIGIVFNLDEHDQPGSHWVAMYSDFKKGEIYFFDSYGTKPERRIRSLMRKHALFCKNEMKINNINVDYNKIRHQYENSECGVYSMNFILRMVKGESFESICKSKVPDKKINKCRNIYFRSQTD